MSDSTEERRFGEHIQQQTRQNRKQQRKRRLQEAVEEANKEIATGNYAQVGRILRDVVIPLIQNLEHHQPWPVYHRELDSDSETPWHWSELKRFLDDADKYLQTAAIGRQNSTTELLAAARGGSTQYEEACAVIRKALDSLESVTNYHDITESGMRNSADVYGFSVKLGEHKQDWDQFNKFGDSMRGVSSEAGALKTLHTGGTGMGKSTGGERELEDFFQRNFDEGRDYKVIDLVGPRDGETWFYDIPQQQPPLRRIREDFGLPADFTESDDLGTPEIEILVPLTPGLFSQELPFDTDSETFTVQPFTVPASEINKSLLISFVASRLSEGQEETVRSSYQTVEDRINDWSLSDLAEEIRSRDELPPKNKATAVNVLSSLQSTGFIRTKDHDHALNWRRIFQDTETVTVFSQAFCGEDTDDNVATFIALAYLISTIPSKRRSTYPQVAVLAREMWKIAPHKRRQSAFAEVAALQENIAQIISEIFRENRHSGIHLIADTQTIRDLHVSVREMFNRYVIYSATRDTIKDVFEWTNNEKYKGFNGTMSQTSGEAGVVGQIQPAVDEREVEYISPMQYVPPSHHHRIAPGDDIGVPPDYNGWKGRVKYLTPTAECEECGSEDLERAKNGVQLTCRDCGHEERDTSMGRNEELRQPVNVEGVEWDDEVPDELRIDSFDRGSDTADARDSPVAAFAQRALAESSIDERLVKRDIYAAFNEFLRREDKERWDFDDQSRTTKFGDRITDALDVDTGKKRGKNAYCGVEWTNFGQDLFEASGIDVEDSAEPIRDG